VSGTIEHFSTENTAKFAFVPPISPASSTVTSVFMSKAEKIFPERINKNRSSCFFNHGVDMPKFIDDIKEDNITHLKKY
jgi:hypothetical protein